MSLVQSIPGSIPQGIAQAITGASAVVDTLVFHALDDVAGSFVADVIVGTGVLTEACTSTRYCPDDSSVHQPFSTGIPGEYYAGGKWWLYGAPAATNSQIYGQDHTNVEWTKSNMTAAFDAVGMTGAANTASTLTATAANATSIANVIVDASDDQTTRWFIKRKTGTGTINITLDNGSTWQDVTTEVDSTAGFNQCIEYLAATTNQQIGIRIVTDTDAVYVGSSEAQLGKTEAQVRGSSPIFTSGSTVTINTTDLSFDDANHDDTEGGYYAEWFNASTDGSQPFGFIGLGSSGRLMYMQASTSFRSADGTTTTSEGVTTALDTVYGVALAYGGVLKRLNFDGTWGTAGDYDGVFDNSQSKLRVLATNSFVSGSLGSTQLLRNVRRYAEDYVTAQATIDGLMP